MFGTINCTTKLYTPPPTCSEMPLWGEDRIENLSSLHVIISHNPGMMRMSFFHVFGGPVQFPAGGQPLRSILVTGTVEIPCAIPQFRQCKNPADCCSAVSRINHAAFDTLQMRAVFIDQRIAVNDIADSQCGYVKPVLIVKHFSHDFLTGFGRSVNIHSGWT